MFLPSLKQVGNTPFELAKSDSALLLICLRFNSYRISRTPFFFDNKSNIVFLVPGTVIYLWLKTKIKTKHNLHVVDIIIPVL